MQQDVPPHVSRLKTFTSACQYAAHLMYICTDPPPSHHAASYTEFNDLRCGPDALPAAGGAAAAADVAAVVQDPSSASELAAAALRDSLVS
jgi:hypothetical protein